MQTIRLSALALAGLFVVASTHAASLIEDFSGDPATRGWRRFGDTNLFRWNPANQNLEVTWDSSRGNSYFYRPLGTVLAKDDDFSLAFDLRLSDIAAGVDTNKPGPFEIAVGFINADNATAARFIRGTGLDSPNLVEFDYFPDTGFGATVSTLIISSNSLEYSDGGFVFPLELAANDLFHVDLAYTAVNQTLTTVLKRNGEVYGPANVATLGTNFSDFRVDTIAVSSYGDAGQDPLYAGSILAHGTLDHFVVTTPEPPIRDLDGGFVNGLALGQVQFASKTNWLYALERTEDLRTWAAASASAAGSGGVMLLQDTNAPVPSAFYRVRAERP